MAESWSNFSRYSLSPNKNFILFVPVYFTAIRVLWISMIVRSRAKGGCLHGRRKSLAPEEDPRGRIILTPRV